MRLEDVAIVIPSYNSAKTLTETLHSALDQSDVATEIIVVDDGSSDNSLDIAKSFQPRVRVVTGPNRGVSSARNTGTAETRAPWLTFLDSDDCLEPGTLAKRLASASATNADVVISDWLDYIDDGAGNLTGHRSCSIDWPAMERDAEVAIATHVWAPPAAILYRRELVERIGGFRVDLPPIEDARFLFDAAYYGARFAHAPHVGARYRRLPGSLSRRDPGRFWANVFLNTKQIEAAWSTRGPLSGEQRRALSDVYDSATRGLFASGHADYPVALSRLRGIGLPPSRKVLCLALLTQIIGIKPARQLLQWIGKV